MKKQLTGLISLMVVVGITLSGCSSSPSASSDSPSDPIVQSSSSVLDSTSASSEMEDDIPSNQATELIVRFGDEGAPFTMQLENNSTAAAIAGYVGTSDWRLPIYNYDESDVMQYYDIPSRYEIPDNSEAITQAHAGDVFYSDPNRIVLFYHDAEISEEYTKIGTFEATDEFVAAVENNPVQEGWGNKLVLISDEE